MKSHTKYLTLTVPGKMTFVNITPEVADAVRQSGVQEGLVLVKAKHAALRALTTGPGPRN
ncbi:MAG: hypothetical protein EXR98_22400 [Gemmataceae bacterium]|nr:hypothetical protein [Gemmataceae bacterium]